MRPEKPDLRLVVNNPRPSVPKEPDKALMIIEPLSDVTDAAIKEYLANAPYKPD
jgi:hypothetical protein